MKFLKQQHKFKLEHWRIISAGLMIFDAIAIAAAYFLALLLRFDCQFSAIPLYYLSAYYDFICIHVLFTLIVFGCLHLYRSLWRFASLSELVRTGIATLISLIFNCVGITVFVQRMPLSYYIFGILIQFALTLGIRFSYRFLVAERRRILASKENTANILLIGAGAAGQLILRETKRSPQTAGDVKCIIDDNPNKWGRYVEGVLVEGGRESIFSCVEKYKIDKIYIAIPSATPEQKRDILEICKETGCEMKNLPGLYQLYNGEVRLESMKEVSVEDLLGRDPIRVDMSQIFRYLTGKVVLITGGAGSIGSELSRQIAAHAPKQLIIFDVYENSAYDLQLELKDQYPELHLVVLIGSVRDSRKIDEVFAEYKPDVVFHAAAHKHVPLMEDSPCEAIKNNAIGTYKTAYAAMRNGCQRFVLISTDKAVNPTNIMGASKRLCEMVIQGFDQKIKAGTTHQIPKLFTHAWDGFSEGTMNEELPSKVQTEFVAVRFGNVLGSNGSVIPVFKRQIAKGGPVTVTHPDIIRYFMTIPEAVSLVLQAATFASGGEIFVLDMGSPVKIDTLARNLIKLSGLKPDVDIMIKYTGLRPGEKLYEEKLMSEEGLRKTSNDLIHIGCPIPFDADEFFVQLNELMQAAHENSSDIRERVAKIVTTYHPAGESGVAENEKATLKEMAPV